MAVSTVFPVINIYPNWHVPYTSPVTYLTVPVLGGLMQAVCIVVQSIRCHSEVTIVDDERAGHRNETSEQALTASALVAFSGGGLKLTSQKLCALRRLLHYRSFTTHNP
jgi:hypothetical protein